MRRRRRPDCVQADEQRSTRGQEEAGHRQVRQSRFRCEGQGLRPGARRREGDRDSIDQGLGRGGQVRPRHRPCGGEGSGAGHRPGVGATGCTHRRRRRRRRVGAGVLGRRRHRRRGADRTCPDRSSGARLGFQARRDRRVERFDLDRLSHQEGWRRSAEGQRQSQTVRCTSDLRKSITWTKVSNARRRRTPVGSAAVVQSCDLRLRR